MIKNKTFHISCNSCGFEESYTAEDFYDFLKLIKEDEWLSIKEKGIWQHFCPEHAWEALDRL
jgi:hypothetical protein